MHWSLSVADILIYIYDWESVFDLRIKAMNFIYIDGVQNTDDNFFYRYLKLDNLITSLS
jgi:hypothetical protein